MPTYRLVSFDLCPYVQRSVAALHENGVPFEVDYIDLKNKPDWFRAISPLGKVPTLVVRDDDDSEVVLFESLVINEYLDHVGGGKMLPSDALARARARAWTVFADRLLSDNFALTSAKDEAALDRVLVRMREKMDRLEQELAGPFFLGDTTSLVDMAFIPALQRTFFAEQVHPALRLFADRPKVSRWWAALDAREATQRSAPADLEPRWKAMVARDRGGYRSVIGERIAGAETGATALA